MIAVCADDLVAAFTLDLDTTPPVVAVSATEFVEPPDSWEVTLTANEDLGGADLTFIDSLGFEHALSYALEGARTIRIVLPTLSLSSGGGRLYVSVRDLVCNATPLTIPVLVLRPRPWDATLTIFGAFAAEVTMDDSFTATIEIAQAFAAEVTQDEAFQSTITIESAFAVDLEVFDAQ